MLPAVLVAILMLVIGAWLRMSLRFLQWIFVPASIVGGFVGLLAIQCLQLQDTELVSELKSWPGFLIAIVFACMFLGGKSKSLRQSLKLAGREGVVVWIIVLGQTAIGLWCTWLLIQPFYDVPNSFGMLIETGFAGGHGTAAAMGTVFASDSIDLDDGLDLGLFMATVGLVMSVMTGVLYVNIAIRRGWVQNVEKVELVQGLELRSNPETMAKGVVRSEVIDPLVFQILIVGVAFAIGWGMKEGVTYLTNMPSGTVVAMSPDVTSAGRNEAQEVLSSRVSLAGTIGDFPLFIYTLFGGMVVRKVLQLTKLDDLIDPQSVQRINGVAMEFLIVAAIATLRLEAVAGLAVPLAILIMAAFLWTGFCLLVIGRRLLPESYWFELGILNYGMSTGTTATGFTLLKIVDRDLSSGAAEDYALAAPLSSPFVGGGMVTIGLPLLLLERVHIAVPAVSLTVIVFILFFAGWRLARLPA